MKQYEIANHLGNVRITFSDVKNYDPVALSYSASLSSVNNYYSFGSLEPSRTWSSESYRFGFNGQEMDNEVSGTGNTNTAMFWEYDTRLGRRWNVDPVVKQWESPYACFSGNPIWFTDPLGDTEPERKKAIERARQHLAKHTRYPKAGESFMGQPGGVADCSGLVSDCISYAGYPNHRSPNGVSDGKGGRVMNGVATIVANCDQIEYNQIEAGSAVTFRTNRTSHQGSNGKYDHIGIVTEVYRDENGQITSFKFIHSSTPGTKEMTWNFSTNRSEWSQKDLMLTGAYKWDNEEMYTGGTLSTFEITAKGLMTPMTPLPPKEIPIESNDNEIIPLRTSSSN